jgi:hypothetical protein
MKDTPGNEEKDAFSTRQMSNEIAVVHSYLYEDKRWFSSHHRWRVFEVSSYTSNEKMRVVSFGKRHPRCGSRIKQTGEEEDKE